MNKNFMQLICNELKNIFKTDNSIEKKQEVALFDYFEIVRDNLMHSFQKIIREYERD